jgi:malonate-semialdehyde dehydrogenase (acetylating) / methylmalonate-semialdehyde dehydrogenase
VRFYTKQKIVTQRWPSGDDIEQSFVIPTMR